MSSNKAQQLQRINLLDAYRMIAIMWVALFHFGYYWTSKGAGDDILPYDTALTWIPLASVGVLGVSLFFMISGFVIALTLQSTPGMRLFFVKRFARLWPTLLVCGAITFCISSLMGPEELQRSWAEAIISMLLLPPQHVGLLTGNVTWSWLDGAYWSLWVELKFYVIIGVLYYTFPKRWFEAWVAFAILSFSVQILNITMTSSMVDMADGLLFVSHIPFFTIGMAASRYKRDQATELDIVAVVTSIVIAAFNLLSPNTTEPVTVALLCGHLLILGLFAVFVWRPQTLSWMEQRWVLKIGRASYAFYLLHQVVGISLIVAIASVAGWVISLVALPFIMALLVMVSMIIFDRVEQPANRWIVSKYKKRVGASEVEKSSAREEREFAHFGSRFG